MHDSARDIEEPIAMIQLRGVTSRYSGRRDVAVLHSIDLDIAKGEMVSDLVALRH
jgi:ABC-type nitrate/sulfonate/bicarbonate transport system ATPase subunit